MANSEEDQTTKTVRVWPTAFEALQDLQSLLAVEKGMPNLTLTEAASLAILEAMTRRARVPSKAKA